MIDIACAADSAYVPHSAVMMRSALLQHAPGQIRIHFLHTNDVTSAELKKLETLVSELGGQFFAHEVAEHLLADLPSMGRISTTMWLRIFLPNILPEVRLVLYLDCDTLVTSSLVPLWQLDLAECALGVVENIFEHSQRGHPHRIGLASTTRYFNSGVLLFNLEYWRLHNLSQELLRFVALNRERLVWPDQDALNLICERRVLFLDPVWNAQNSAFLFDWGQRQLGGDTLQRVRSCPAIVHFEGGGFAKPWHALCRHPYANVYREHRRAIEPEGHFVLDGDRWFNPLLRLLPMVALLNLLSVPTWLHQQRIKFKKRLRKLWKRIR